MPSCRNFNEGIVKDRIRKMKVHCGIMQESLPMAGSGEYFEAVKSKIKRNVNTGKAVLHIDYEISSLPAS